MPEPYPRVRLDEVLERTVEQTIIQPDKRYRQVTIRLNGRGVRLRDEVPGTEIASKKRTVVRAGQFIYSKIDARNGAFGVVPVELEGAVVTNDFPSFAVYEDRLLTDYLKWLSRTDGFVARCGAGSEGSTNRVRLSEGNFLDLDIALPPLAEQRRVVARVESIADKAEAARRLLAAQEKEAQALLLSVFQQIVANAPYRPMDEVAPLVRRPVTVGLTSPYGEIGLRSFGKGVFHKPEITGVELGRKRVFWIREGDLLFSNVFAWEGAIAVAGSEDEGRIGSHRFITCVPDPDLATASFLCFFFLTPEGLEQIQEASPGGAGRNRTLGLRALANIPVPVPPLSRQREFDALQAQVRRYTEAQATTHEDLDALMPSVLDRAFRGVL